MSLQGDTVDALRAVVAEIRKQAPEPGCPEDIAYYDGHMAAARVVDEIADELDRAMADGHACIAGDCPGCAAALTRRGTIG